MPEGVGYGSKNSKRGKPERTNPIKGTGEVGSNVEGKRLSASGHAPARGESGSTSGSPVAGPDNSLDNVAKMPTSKGMQDENHSLTGLDRRAE